MRLVNELFGAEPAHVGYLASCSQDEYRELDDIVVCKDGCLEEPWVVPSDRTRGSTTEDSIVGNTCSSAVFACCSERLVITKVG